MPEIKEGDLLWSPSPEVIKQANLIDFMHWLSANKNLSFNTYDELWRWSVSQISDFWESVWDYCGVIGDLGSEDILLEPNMPGTKWFPETTVNYAENVFHHLSKDQPAIYYKEEDQPLVNLSTDTLRDHTAAIRQALLDMGVKPGDRVAAYLPNTPQAIIGFLATSSLGAIWSSCAPDFGSKSILDRFQQIEPKVLICTDGYQYNGRNFSRVETIKTLRKDIPSLEHIIVIKSAPHSPIENTDDWNALIETYQGLELTFEAVPFDHPLWILYSSGTTGLPKPIVHGHGGCLLEHFKAATFHNDLKPKDIFFWYTSTGWMMWNYMVGCLLTGCSIFLYNGSPAYPTINVLWQLAEQIGVTYFGTSPAFISACRKAAIKPNATYNLTKIRGVGSTGAPLTIDGFQWVYENINDTLALESLSGGTDLCTAFVGGVRIKPVYAGEIQGPSLGAKIQALGPDGAPIIGEVGELVISAPMPSMPLFFWNDDNMVRYRSSYFEMYPGIWRHGDWIKFTKNGGCIIYGRSDSTINRKGVRMGTSEIYRCVEALDDIMDALVVDLDGPNDDSYMPLFIVLRDGAELTSELRATIKKKLRYEISPRHVPDDIYTVKEIPYTLSGKKLEIPVKRLLLGGDPATVVNRGAMRNPETIDLFIQFADSLAPKK